MPAQIDAASRPLVGLFTVLFNNAPLMLVRARSDHEALARAARSLVYLRGVPQISAEVDRQLYTGPAKLQGGNPVADDRFDARPPTPAEWDRWDALDSHFRPGSEAALSGLLL